jgi:hypothetical protein
VVHSAAHGERQGQALEHRLAQRPRRRLARSRRPGAEGNARSRRKPSWSRPSAGSSRRTESRASFRLPRSSKRRAVPSTWGGGEAQRSAKRA